MHIKKYYLAVTFLALAGALGIFALPAEAAVTQRTAATELITASQKIIASSGNTPLFGVGLTQSASETLSSIKVTITGTATGTDIANLKVFADTSNTGANDDVIDGGDTLCGTLSNVVVGAVNTINAGACAIPSSGTGSYDFIVSIATSATIADDKTITFSVASGTTTYGLSSGSVSATALTAANSLTAAPGVSSVSVYDSRTIVVFTEAMNGQLATNCANYVFNGTALSCGGTFGTPFIEFKGNRVVIRNKSFTAGSTVTFSVPSTSTLKSTSGSSTTVAAYSSSTTVQALVLPSITSITPGFGAVGDSVTIAGTNFGTPFSAGTTQVFFSGGFGSFGPLPMIGATSETSRSATSITLLVPSGAKGGPVVVRNNGIDSDMNQNSFFDIQGTLTAKVYYSADNSSPMPDADKGNIRFAFAGMGGMTIRQNGGSGVTYTNGSPGTFSLTGVRSMGMFWAYDTTGTHLGSLPTMIDTTTPLNIRLIATTRTISGTLTMGSSCTASGQDKTVMVMALPDVVNTGDSNFKEVNPAFFTTGPANGQTACQTTYNVAVPINGTYRLEAHIPPDASATTVTSAGYTDPDAQTATITNSALTATLNFTFAAATHRIVGTVVRSSGSLTTAEKGFLWVFAHQPQGGRGTGTQVGADGTFTLNVTKGTWLVEVMGPNMPFPVQTQVNVDDTYAIAQPAKGPTIIIAPPTTYIEGYAKDSTGTGLSNVSVYAYRTGGPGGGHANTDSQGYYKMFVPAATDYKVGAFSQTYGSFTEQTNIVVSSSSNPTVNFTVSATGNYTISGTVTKGGQALQSAFVSITSGENGSMMGFGNTDSSGAYSAKVPGGNYWIHVGVPGKGEIYKTSLGTIAANATQNISINTSTVIVRISPASSVNQAFVGVHSSSNSKGGFASTSTVTASCTGSGTSCKEYQIDVLRPTSGTTTYYVEANVGGNPLSAVSFKLDSSGNFTETSGTANDGVIEYSISTTLYTVAGTVSGTDVSSAYVWAASSSGGTGAQVDSNGAYSIQLANGTYTIGVNKPGYTGNTITVIVNGANLTGKNLTLSAASQTITGTVYLPDGTTTVTDAKVWAINGSSGGWAGTTTDATGAYSLSVGSGTWTVKAAYDGYNYNGTPAAAGSSGVNITLVAISGFNPSPITSPITPNSGGTVQTTGAKVDFPKNALGTDSSSATVQVKSTTNIPTVSSSKIVGTPKEVTATNSSNQSITTLSGSATIALTASKTDLSNQGITTIAQVQKMTISYWDSTSNNWVSIPTTVSLSQPTATTISALDDDPAVTLTGTVTHLSDFALVSPSGVVTLAVPGAASAAAGDGVVTVSWSPVTGATKYDIYQQSGSNFPYIAQTTSTSYMVSGLTNGTSYSFKVSALDDSSNESAATDAVSAIPAATNAGGGGGGGGGSSSSQTASVSQPVISLITPTPPASPPPAATPQNSSSNTISIFASGVAGIPSTYIFQKVLNFGQISKDVRYLQLFLKSQSAAIYPEGIVNGRFGPATKKAVVRFQEKYASELLKPLGLKKGTGKVGAMTLKKINSIMGK